MKDKHLYIISVLIFIAGLIAFANYVYVEYHGLNDYLVKFEIPGTTEIDIEKPGMYNVFFEGAGDEQTGIFGNKENDSNLPLVVSNSEGISMPIQRTPVPSKYSYRGRRGESVFEVNLPRTGSYQFQGLNLNAGNNKRITLILDKGFSDRRSKTIVTAQAILLFPIVASLVLFLYAYSRSRL